MVECYDLHRTATNIKKCGIKLLIINCSHALRLVLDCFKTQKGFKSL